MPHLETIERLRAFNRYYTNQLGLLNEQPYGSEFSLTEARILFELAHNGRLKPLWFGTTLGLDAAYVSRILKRFADRGLVTKEKDPDDGRGVIITLTEKGRLAFEPINDASARSIAKMLEAVDESGQDALVEAADRITAILSGSPRPEVILRPMRVGDLGHVTSRQALLYAEEYGWDLSYEGLVAGLFAEFVRSFDPAKEASFIAASGRDILGSVFLFRGDMPDMGKLRLLYVEPSARGLGLGRRLVGACIDAARERGYKRLTLWTQDCLSSARRVYQNAGFSLVSEERHHSFGKDLNGQIWSLAL